MVKTLFDNSGDIRDIGLIPGSERSPGEGHSNTFQYSCLEKPMDRGAWWATVHSVTKTLSVGTEYCLFLAFAGGPHVPFLKGKRASSYGTPLEELSFTQRYPKNTFSFFFPLLPTPRFSQLSGPEWCRRMLSQPHHGAALWGIAVQFSL